MSDIKDIVKDKIIDIFKNKPKEIVIPPETNEEKIAKYHALCDQVLENFHILSADQKIKVMGQIMDSHKLLFKTLILEQAKTKIERN